MDRASFRIRLYQRTIGKYRLLRTLPGEVYLRSNRDIRIEIKTIETGNIVALCIRQHGLAQNTITYELEETEVFLNRIRRASVFFDVGAHIGYYSLLAAAHNETSQVVAFELLDRFCREVEFHARNNGLQKIVVEPVALGDGKAEVAFGNHADYRRKTSVSLDEYVDETGRRPDLIKMDVEGFEYLALEGARHTLSSRKPELLLALHPQSIEELGGSVGSVMALLQEYYPYIYRITESPVAGLALNHYLSMMKKDQVIEEPCSLYCSPSPLG